MWAASPSDAASVRSLPAVHIAEHPPPPRPSTSSTSTSPSAVPPSSVPHSPTSPHHPDPSGPPPAQQQRGIHRRSTIEIRSNNRLSGFFNNLIHRREPTLSASSREPEDTPKQTTEKSSRTPSPSPTNPPPPSLPPPSLHELGLSLSVITSDLSPNHFSTPPASGAFLAPHYLLLCHAQGLDVLPLTSPPSPQPYALVRRVAFKSVVVMEHRGVLVAVAGRRDGVRVYALEEVKKAIEWRIDVEIRRERERLRREAAKRIVSRSENELPDAKSRKASLSTPPPMEEFKSLLRKASYGKLSPSSLPPPPPPLVPRAPRTPTRIRPKSRGNARLQHPPGQPPPYANPAALQRPPNLRNQPSAVSVRAGAHGTSINHVLAGVSTSHNHNQTPRSTENNMKSDDWAGSSDDEAIDIRAAASGSQVLDERTSATHAANRVPASVAPPSSSTSSSRRQRPSNLDLSASRTANIAPPEPSPTPTLLTLRQALQQNLADAPDPFDDIDDDEDETTGRISLTQALMESRLPDLPPPGTVQPQEAILLSAASSAFQETSSPRSSEGDGSPEIPSQSRNRWSAMFSGPTSFEYNHGRASSSSQNPLPSSSYLSPDSDDQGNTLVSRSPSFQSNSQLTASAKSSASADPSSPSVASSRASLSHSTMSMTSRSSRFIPKIISSAFSRRSDERGPSSTAMAIEADKWLNAPPQQQPAAPPKLEYVKLPGTKGALMIKAVETPKKSFLAILCGENGEKVELFAGTYRTALGLSRTFILPDSPRSLELQLQGDDLVEVFLVFSQNVFGLEPATVRVREVRIGRAERRAARRRARETRGGDSITGDNEVNEEDATGIGVSVAVASVESPTRSSTPPLTASDHPDAPEDVTNNNVEQPSDTTSTSPTDELLAVASAQIGPYTTFQQLQFTPHFPLAAITDDFVIPPAYPTFLEYRDRYEQEEDANTDCIATDQQVESTQFSPPGLPAPTPMGPTQWHYKDPKGITHGPWSSALMQAWHRDGLLPPDLPICREGETEYTLLRELKLQCVDPANPFRSLPASPISTNAVNAGTSSKVKENITSTTEEKPLLAPISLLAQPKYFGPPALFFSSRGGHSTSIVDARGRSVLKSRFFWSNDDSREESKVSIGKMGDIKRLEALDVKNRSVLVAMRQGGLEAVDLNDALLRPADQSRTVLPSFNPSSLTVNRRPPYVWKIGTPVDSAGAALSSKGKSGLPKKAAIGITKSATNSQLYPGADMDTEFNDDVLFLGRKEDEIYFCERNAGSFRILRLSPDA